MKIGIFIYSYILFLLSTPNFIFSLSKKLTIPIMLLYSLIFTIILYFTFDLVNSEKESFQITDFEIDGINPLTQVIDAVLGKNDSAEVTINNDMGDSQIIGGASDTINSPQEDSVLKPISKIKSGNTPVQEEKLKKNNQMVSEQYEKAYNNFFLTPYDQNLYNQSNSLSGGCQANYNDPEPCCGQPGVTVSANHICSKQTPICVGYVASENKLGKCISAGGTTSNKVTVLGKYNMQPWSMKSSWTDKNAQWIWFTENANIGTTPNSSAIFQYVYFFDEIDDPGNYIDVEITIACDCYCYMEFKNNNENLMEPIVQVGTGNQAGRTIKSRLQNGANIMNLYCCNNSYENKPAGILLSVSTENQSKILFSTNDSWTWYQTAPSIDSVILKNTVTYLPIVALWNSSYKSFLVVNNNILGLMQTNAKKLNNSLACENVYFQYQKNDDNTISLYNCANKLYVSLENNISTSATKGTSEELNVQTNVNASVSFMTIDKQYLSINKKNALELNPTYDESVQWEIIYLDIIKVGTNRTIDNVPKYIGHVGNTPLDSNNNASFITQLKTDNLNSDTNSLQITRIDANYYSSWQQELLLPGINKIFLDKLSPKLELLVNANKLVIRQILVYNDMLYCVDKNGIIYSKSLHKTKSDWRQIMNPTINVHGVNSGIGGNMVVGKFNSKDVLFAIGPYITVSWTTAGKYGAIYYRSMDSLYDSNDTWKLYSAQSDGSALVKFTSITYCNKNEKLYGISMGKLYVLNYNNGYVLPMLMINSSSLDYIVHPLKETGGYIFSINNKFQTYRQPINLNTNKLGESMMITSNIDVIKITIVNDIVFCLGKNDGKIYYVPLYGGNLKEFGKNMQGNLIYITNYNDVIYAIDNENNIVKTQIVI